MRLSIFPLLGLLALAGCATSPLGRTQFAVLPDEQMAVMGDQAFVNLKRNQALERDSRTNAYVTCVAEAVVRQVGGQWEIAVFQDPSPNAFALPGGKLGVHSGILAVATNQHELATVIAHEIAHVLSRHTNERVSQELALKQGLSAVQAVADPVSPTGQALMGLLGVGAEYGILMPYNRLQESEADLLGLDLMARAGFDPSQSLALWQNMDKVSGAQPVEFLSTHPSHATRMQDLQRRIPNATALSRQAQANGLVPRCDDLRTR
ncbi:M48 family metallopeptidase [Methylococcus sp. EFPC2]|uniref:M48 family metallopeptidase n=1 Tax=Methylococcus sp. EFPC2 TaxID=2812648 RepID=UPI001967B2B1|nr:M48 family metallopeptidase [Methylococcus sp. EFPC2]QSA96235.1 M48 family metallopeptidase [Methylococcus sp. EFPC2]